MIEIYELFFKGIASTKDVFVKKVELLKLSEKQVEELLGFINPEWLELNDISSKDFPKKKATAKKATAKG